MVSKGYAKETFSQPVAAGRNWYILHHHVYHPAKPEKIRVFFGCSAKYGQTSLNQELMSGPDLTNQTLEILLIFREGRIAFMADIKTIFYQVLVPEEHRSFLRFLWWKDNNTSNNTVDYEMNLHVFGGTSSPSCSNYALRRTATDIEDKFGKEAAVTLENNFCVDDLLKLVNTVKDATSIIYNAIAMCAAAGCNLTKFTSNRKEVLLSILMKREGRR